MKRTTGRRGSHRETTQPLSFRACRSTIVAFDGPVGATYPCGQQSVWQGESNLRSRCRLICSAVRMATLSMLEVGGVSVGAGAANAAQAALARRSSGGGLGSPSISHRQADMYISELLSYSLERLRKVREILDHAAA